VTNEIKVPDEDHPITIHADTARVVARVGGTVIADTDAALTLCEAGYSPVHYIPLDDAVAGTLRTSRTRSYCPYKGDASTTTSCYPTGPNSVTPPGPTRIRSRPWMPSPAAWRFTPTAFRFKPRRRPRSWRTWVRLPPAEASRWTAPRRSVPDQNGGRAGRRRPKSEHRSLVNSCTVSQHERTCREVPMPAKGSAEWRGDVPTGTGTSTAGDTISGGYTYKSRFEDGPGSNPSS